ncbi:MULTISPECIES: OprO/OprP family phosphate-selective porin [Pseudomonas]|uniref:OprO/OprP family phosphate-selective porin n=1 Tax=Pseudomonas TaxID=286 RepID=UPI000908E196|nr:MULTISPECIES: OprO/OprP family phosphate-selective porin [Pseudomonas]TCV67101.1 phosphate-selective porin OprO/OprP [Pseudomonas fluorescens]SFW73473.1 phosphate-selective porin OprO and OprP [Pseudomonas sp. NFACC04-2]
MIRKHFAGVAASALAMAVTAQAFAGTVTTDGADIVVKTKGGLEVATTDKEFSFKLGGRLQADYSQFDGIYTDNGKSADAAYIRRAFLELSGVLYTDWAYTINYDMSHNSGDSDNGYFDEASLAYNGFKPVSIKVGRFDPDFGLEKATSSKWVTAPERNAAYDLIDWTNSHQNGLGIQASSTFADSFYASAGVFSKDTDDTDGDSVKQVNGRFVFAPMHEAGNVLHFGLNVASRDVSDTAFDARYRSRLGMRGVETLGGNDAGPNGNRPVLGGANNSPAGSYDTDTAFGLEAAFAMGPASIQGEYISRKTKADSDAFEDLKGHGFYVQGAYTITGESRGYKVGKFDAIKPQNKSIGAWEVFYRFDSMTVEDDNITTASATREVGDAEAKVHNLGVNWYANEAVKITGAYVKAKTDKVTNANGDDDGDGFVVRAQYVF